MLTEKQKNMLKGVARSPYHPMLGHENGQLEVALAMLKAENPQAFLSEFDLGKRRFFHKPSNDIPFLTFIKEKL